MYLNMDVLMPEAHDYTDVRWIKKHCRTATRFIQYFFANAQVARDGSIFLLVPLRLNPPTLTKKILLEAVSIPIRSFRQTRKKR